MVGMEERHRNLIQSSPQAVAEVYISKLTCSIKASLGSAENGCALIIQPR